MTDWYVQMTGISTTFTSLKVTYRGRSSASCTQVVSICNWTTGACVTFDTRAVGTTEVEVSVAAGGTLADYVSGTTGNGDVAVRIRCSRSDALGFFTGGDLLKVGFTS